MEPVKNHFRGEITEVALDEKQVAKPKALAVDLREMARSAMNYFLRTPFPHLNYACRFSNNLAECPPGPQGEDLVANGDTDVRMDSVLPGLREISGRTDSQEVDVGLHKRVLSYLGEDGLGHVPFAMVCSPDMPPDTLMTSLWTTGWIIRNLTERYLRSQEPALKKRARRLAVALRKIASWDTGRAYYPGAHLVNGEWIGGFFSASAKFYTLQVGDLMHYAEASADEEIAEFAHALARGILTGFPGGLGMRRFREDGSFTDHTYLHLHALWGVAKAGRVMLDPALIEWARRGYEFVRSCGTDFGWFPERIILPGEHPVDGYEGRVDVSETCCMGDMTQIAAELARSGYPHYWDHVERYVSNYLREVQFAITPDIEEFYRNLHAALSKEEVERGLRIMRDFEGGFLSDVGVNQWKGPAGFGPLPMAGCCVPGGAEALVSAWNGIVTREGGHIKVNMSFDHDGPLATVKTGTGRIEVTAKQKGTHMVRPPAWAERKSVKTFRGGKEVQPDWAGDYLRFSEANPGERLTLTWQVPRFRQRVQVGGRLGFQHPYTVEWKGNRVVEIRPPGRVFPMFSGRRFGGSLAGLIGT